MNEKQETRTRPMKPTKGRRYKSVPEMVRDLSPDAQFADSVEKRIAERNIINHLMARRSLLEMSQKDIADHMRCTQSRISKLENGKDDDLSIGDFHGYTDALGFEMVIMLAPKNRTVADDLRHHAGAMQKLIGRLCELAGNDQEIIKGALGLIAQTAAGFTSAIDSFLKKLPSQPTLAPSPIHIEVQESGPPNAGNRLAPPVPPAPQMRRSTAKKLDCATFCGCS